MQKEENPSKTPKEHKTESLCIGSFIPSEKGCQQLKNHQADKDSTLNFQNKAIRLKEREDYGGALTSFSWRNCLFNSKCCIIMYVTVWDMKSVSDKEKSGYFSVAYSVFCFVFCLACCLACFCNKSNPG